MLAHFLPLIVLAQTTNRNAATNQVLIWVGVLILAMMVLGAALMVLRRKMFDKSSDAAAAGTMMEQLREMRRRGEISDAEFDKARCSLSQKMTADVRAAKKDVAAGRPTSQTRRPNPDRSDPLPGYDLTGDSSGPE